MEAADNVEEALINGAIHNGQSESSEQEQQDEEDDEGSNVDLHSLVRSRSSTEDLNLLESVDQYSSDEEVPAKSAAKAKGRFL